MSTFIYFYNDWNTGHGNLSNIYIYMAKIQAILCRNRSNWRKPTCATWSPQPISCIDDGDWTRVVVRDDNWDNRTAFNYLTERPSLSLTTTLDVIIQWNGGRGILYYKWKLKKTHTHTTLWYRRRDILENGSTRVNTGKKSVLET